jgi:NAD(P)-dependent dehydrogenase (short-subunit alcohol dehydrogenase family)
MGRRAMTPSENHDIASPLSLFSLEGKKALVTGASSGLGRRFAQVLDAAGVQVAIVARRAERLEDLARELRDPVVIVADLEDPESPHRVVERASDSLGGLDVVVNNAGTTSSEPAVDDESFQRIVNLNLTVPFEIARYSARHAITNSRALSIVNITSVIGMVASRSIPQTSYAASKAGLAHLTRELANQWARSGIRVNAIAPGWFPSEITNGPVFEDPKGLQHVQRNTPMGRPGMVHELDGPLLFLASDASSFVTGQVLVVDGGWTII